MILVDFKDMFMPFDRGVLKLVHSETLQSITTRKDEASIFFLAHLDFSQSACGI